MVMDAVGPKMMGQLEQHPEEPPNMEAKKFFDLLHSAKQPLWEGFLNHS
jgi:hypothetical protein